jgi:2-desacetyl-2-hydroxyethyl bacteriochlorophyllide A dehydrogenase
VTTELEVRASAAVLSAPRELTPTTIAVPRPGPGELLVRVVATGICGSDLATYRNTHPYKRPPVVLGHELAGVVCEAGPSVEGLSVGDRVCAASFSPCERCAYCLRGEENLCPGKRAINHRGWDGSFAEYVLLHRNMTFALPDEVGFEHGALVEPLSVAARAVRLARSRGARTLAVLGSGSIGLACVLVARRMGFERIVCSDVSESKRDLARELGAHEFVRVGPDTGASAIAAQLGDGADAAIVASGHAGALDDAAAVVTAGGVVVIVAYFASNIEIDVNTLVRREVALLPSALSTSRDFDDVIGWLARGEIDPGPLVTHRFQLADVPQAMRLLDKPHGRVGKIMLQVGSE